jgi:hypothetical protein
LASLEFLGGDPRRVWLTDLSFSKAGCTVKRCLLLYAANVHILHTSSPQPHFNSQGTKETKKLIFKRLKA